MKTSYFIKNHDLERMQMKIIHIVESFGGGVYSFLVDLCNNTCSEYEISVYYSIRKETPDNFRKDFNSSINLINIDMCREPNFKKDIKALFQIIKIIKEEKPDIIHLHSSKAGFLGRMAYLLSGYRGCKIFYNPHGFSFLQNNISKLKRNIYFTLEKIATLFGGYIIAVSKSEYNEALKLTNKCKVIFNSVNIDQLSKLYGKNLKAKEQCPIVIGTSGRISYQKNPSLFNKIAVKFPEYKFIWIGDGDLRECLNAKNIEVTGWKTKQESLDLLLNVDIYLQTSLWEGLPIALLEAMALRKPVIVNDAVGNRDLVVNGYNGYIARDCDDFMRFLNELLISNEERKEIGKHAYDYVLQNFSLDKMISEYKALYKK